MKTLKKLIVAAGLALVCAGARAGDHVQLNVQDLGNGKFQLTNTATDPQTGAPLANTQTAITDTTGQVVGSVPAAVQQLQPEILYPKEGGYVSMGGLAFFPVIVRFPSTGSDNWSMYLVDGTYFGKTDSAGWPSWDVIPTNYDFSALPDGWHTLQVRMGTDGVNWGPLSDPRRIFVDNAACAGNVAPSISAITYPAPAPIGFGARFDFSVTALDPESDALTYTWIQTGGETVMGLNSEAPVPPNPPSTATDGEVFFSPGTSGDTYSFLFVANDPCGNSNYNNITVTTP